MKSKYIFRTALCLILLILPIPAARAHAELVSANPIVGSTITKLPSQVSVTFDGNLLTIGGSTTNTLTVTDPNGSEIDTKDSQAAGATLTVGIKPSTLTGTFVVAWRVVSGDGHPEKGSYQFHVGAAPSPSPSVIASHPETPTSSNLSSTSIWLLLLAVVVGVGIWVRFEFLRRKKR